MNKMLYKLDTIENKVNSIETLLSSTSTTTTKIYNFELPITSLIELMHFEDELKDQQFKNQTIYFSFFNYFVLYPRIGSYIYVYF